jgi:phage replication-related protein YjqB (UPF0714/DUF867 family)
MADTYASFSELARHERAGIDNHRRQRTACDDAMVCNLGQTGRGVQLELSHALRLQIFESFSRQGRQRPRAKFRAFVAALCSVVLT